MKKRENTVQKFSTFLSLGDRDNRQKSFWQADLSLERYMKLLVQSDPEAKEEYWARHFLKELREISQDEKGRGAEENLPPPRTQELELSLRPRRHMSAFLQEACLYAAQKSYQKLNFLSHKYPIEECFQIANSAANQPAKILKNFNLQHPCSNLEGYAKTVLVRFIKDKIYQQDIEVKREKFSDYGLLKNLTTKELKEALAAKGMSQPEIELYCLVWQCFDEIYQINPTFGSQVLKTPNQQHLEQIANCYNQRLKNLDFPAATASWEKIKEMLEICIKAARDRRTMRFVPLEDYDRMSDPIMTSWDTVIQEEEWNKVQELVSRLFEAMPEAGQTMLKLWQGLNLTQTEIATVLKNKYPDLKKQYQVARQLGKYTKNLLKSFAIEWNSINPGIVLNEDRDVEQIKQPLNECLQSHCKRLLRSVLNKTVKQYRKNRNQEQLLKNREELKLDFISELETSLHLPLASLELANDRLSAFVEEWIQENIHLSQIELMGVQK